MAAFDLSAIMNALNNQGYVSPQDAQTNQYGTQGGLQGILSALARQGYRPPQLGGNQPNPYGVQGGINAITDAVTGQGAFGMGAAPTSWGFNGNTGAYVPAPPGNMGILGAKDLYGGGMPNAQGQNAIGPPTVRTPPAAAPAAPKYAPHAAGPSAAPIRQAWAGGFGLSDNSAWGNKGQATLENRTGINGSFQVAPNQPTPQHQNYTLPGAGSAFGLGGRQ